MYEMKVLLSPLHSSIVRIMKKFWDKVDKSGDCWIWLGSKNSQGYGYFNFKPSRLAHRVVLMLKGVEIPEGMLVCHHCDNPSCVNPDHLFIGTHKDNSKDMMRKGRSLKGRSHNKEVKPAIPLCELDIWLIQNVEAPATKIADWFGLTPAQARRIRSRA